jgi:hypothetical protein
MSRVHFHETTTARPEQFVAGITDLGPGVRSSSATAVWERLDHDWSDRDRVVMTTTDSDA